MSRTKWTGKDLAQLADALGFGVLYASLYRTACTIAHAGDADGCNPIVPYMLRAKESLAQPFFVSSYGLWGLTDIMSLLMFVFLIPFRLFAEIAKFLGVELDQAEREHFDLVREASQRLTPTMSTDDLAKAFPSFLELSRE